MDLFWRRMKVKMAFSEIVILSIFVSLISISNCERKIQCLDENANPLDWIYMYKLPKQVSSDGSGLEFLFLHSNSSGWKLSTSRIDESVSIPGRLISQLSDEDLVIMYNDEPPGEKSDENRGHTKGVLAGNGQGGFWLVHSVPKYPGSDLRNYSYPPTGHLYGQSFLCLTLNSPEGLEKVGQLITFNEPHVYMAQIPEALEDQYPSLKDLKTNKNWINEPPFYKTKQLEGFTVFAKSRKFQKELYVDWVAPTLQSDLLVESWLHGPGVIPTDCQKPFKVFNVDQIALPIPEKHFKSMEDHSKWAVGQESDWICVGDINRADHQKRRGGGTVCRSDPYISKAYRDLVSALYPCPSNGTIPRTAHRIPSQ